MDSKNNLSPEWSPITSEDLGTGKEHGIMLRNIPLFQDLKQRDWRDISAFFHERHFNAGEVIFQYGTPGLGMYIILKGEVKIIGPEDSENTVYAHLIQNDFFGEMSLVDAIDRSATAIAEEESTLAGIFRPNLEELLKRRPKLGLIIMTRLARIIAYRLRQTNQLLLARNIQSGIRSE